MNVNNYYSTINLELETIPNTFPLSLVSINELFLDLENIWDFEKV